MGRSIVNKGDGEFDPLIEQAAEVARTDGALTRTRLMSLLHIGYGRAARIVDQLVSIGVLHEIADTPGTYSTMRS